MQTIIRREFKNVDINFPFFIAPMVGLTHVAFRELLQGFTPIELCTLWPTEMLNSRRIPSQSLGETPESLKSIFEINQRFKLSPQILGNEEKFIAPSLIRLKSWGAEAIDLNMGCPVKRALKHNYGVALIGDPDYAGKVVEMAVKNTDLPISVKTRAGEKKNIQELLRFIDPIISSGANWITLHPRSAKEKRKGKADWNLVGELRSRVSIPIIGNGDIQTAEMAIEYYNEFYCDGIMIGRGATARPWILWEVAEKLGMKSLTPPPFAPTNKLPQSPEEEAQWFGFALVKFVNLCYKYFEPAQARRRINFFLRNNSNWLNYGQRCLSIFGKTESREDLIKDLTVFFQSKDLKLSKTTSLRY